MKELSIRLPAEIYEQIKTEAVKQKRSINAQINVLIEKVVQKEKQEQ